MMEAKPKTPRCLLTLLSTLFILSGLTACSSTEDSIEDPAKPEVPIADGDWQVVPATGGTITKDSISITFPSGTFAEETKVAITEIQKGKIGGEYEASKFYQIAMPSNAGKTMAVKMKSNDKNDDISFVMNSPGFCISSCEEKTIETLLQTNYSNGEYSATIPAFDQTNSADDIAYLTIGLGHMIGYSSTNTRRTRGVFDEVLHEGKVKNVSYKIRFPWWTLCTNDKDTLFIVEMKAKNINEYVQQALTKIFDLGFKVNGDRYLDIVFDNDENWGGFSNSMVSKKTSVLSLGIKKLLNKDTKERDTKCTVMHELFHFFQSEYDKRCQFEKGRPQLDGGGEDLEIAEMGAVWSEHMFNDGQLNAKWLMNEVLSSIYQDLMSLTNTAERWDAALVKKPGLRYQNQGYSMAPLLYYLCSTKEMEAFKFNNQSVEELHNIWSTHFSIRKQTKSTLDILYDWAKYSHDSNFFSNDLIDDYYLKLLKGELVKGLDIFGYYDFIQVNNLKKSNKDKFFDKLFNIIPFEGTVYPYGYAFRAIQLNGLKGESLKDKKLVIKQGTEGMQTYLLTANRTDKKYERIGTVAKGQDSIVVSGDKLESYRKADGTFDQYFFFVTTRTTNSTSDRGTKPWKVNVELQDEKKEEQPVAKGMINKMYMLVTMEGKTDGGSSTHFGFGFSTESEHHAPPAITTKKNGSTLHVESSQEYTYAIQYGNQTEKQSVSFDILNFTGDLKNATITNFKIYNKTVANVSPPPDEWIIRSDDQEGEIELNNIVSPSVKEMDDGTTRLYFKNGTWKVTAEYGLLEVISGYCIKSGSSSSRTYFYDDSQVAEIEMELYFNK